MKWLREWRKMRRRLDMSEVEMDEDEQKVVLLADICRICDMRKKLWK